MSQFHIDRAAADEIIIELGEPRYPEITHYDTSITIDGHFEPLEIQDPKDYLSAPSLKNTHDDGDKIPQNRSS
jgi:hypothetical protein